MENVGKDEEATMEEFWNAKAGMITGENRGFRFLTTDRSCFTRNIRQYLPHALTRGWWIGKPRLPYPSFTMTTSRFYSFLDDPWAGGGEFIVIWMGTLTNGGYTMLRHIWLVVGLLSSFSLLGCSLDNTPKRLAAYLPQPAGQQGVVTHVALPGKGTTAVLVVLNDSGFEKSAPELRRGTLENLGEYLKTEIHKQLPIHLDSVVYPEGLQRNGSADQFIQLAKEEKAPYLLLAVLSSSEWEVFDRLPMQGNQGGGGMRSIGMAGYRAENYARVELALLDGQTGQPVVSTDGQAWATLERLAVPMESNVYPVVRRAQTQPPIYPNSEGEAFETLRWVSGQDAIAQAVMHLEILWKKNQAT